MITIRLACTYTEFEQAFHLIQVARKQYGLAEAGAEPLGLLKQHALPSTNTIIAVEGDAIVGAIYLVGDSPFGFPLEERHDMRAFRKDLEGRLAEISLPGIRAGFTRAEELRFALYHFAVCFSSTNCHIDGLVTEASAAWAEEHAEKLHFRVLFDAHEGRQPLFLDLRRASLDFRAHVSGALPVEYSFPEKRFFLVAYQSMTPAVIARLFNERTQLFASLGERDLRILKNIYDWGEYAQVLPAGPTDMPKKAVPRHPRFPMSCEGYLAAESGERENVQLLDVSREGLKVRIGRVPDVGASHVLTLFVGVNRKSELIARVIWVDKRAEFAGLEVCSGDANWAKLMDYLEKDYLKIA